MRFARFSTSKIKTGTNSLAYLSLLAIFVLSIPAIGHTQSAEDQQTRQLGNVKGLIVVNSAGGYPSIQDAIDSAATKGGGVVLVPSGRYVVRQIVLRDGVSLMGLGMNPPPHGEGTTLEQAPGSDTDFIVNDPKLSGGGYQHWSRISNLRIVASASGSSRGSGIRFNARTGEGTKLEHLLIIGFPECGVSVSRGAEPFYGDDLHFFRNGRYGIDINRTGGDANQLVKLSMISGDDNGFSLIHIGPSGGLLDAESYLIEGVKAEKHTPGKQNDVILLDNMNGSPVVILGVGAQNTSGEQADAIVRVQGASALLYYFGLSHDKNWAYTINDTVAHRQLPNSAAGLYGADIFPGHHSSADDPPSSGTALKHNRTPACSTQTSDSCDARVTWDQPFADGSYTATCSLEGPRGSARIVKISSKLSDSLTVTIQGRSATGSDETLDCIAIHD
jgi:Pectate lyase superfamily protein